MIIFLANKGEENHHNIAELASCSIVVVKKVMKEGKNEALMLEKAKRNKLETSLMFQLLEWMEAIIQRKDRLLTSSIIRLELRREKLVGKAKAFLKKYMKELQYRWKRTWAIQAYVNTPENIEKRKVFSRQLVQLME